MEWDVGVPILRQLLSQGHICSVKFLKLVMSHSSGLQPVEETLMENIGREMPNPSKLQIRVLDLGLIILSNRRLEEDGMPLQI